MFYLVSSLGERLLVLLSVKISVISRFLFFCIPSAVQPARETDQEGSECERPHQEQLLCSAPIYLQGRWLLYYKKKTGTLSVLIFLLTWYDWYCWLMVDLWLNRECESPNYLHGRWFLYYEIMYVACSNLFVHPIWLVLLVDGSWVIEQGVRITYVLTG